MPSEAKRYKRALKEVWMRAMAAALCRRGGTRFNQLMDEIRTVSSRALHGKRRYTKGAKGK